MRFPMQLIKTANGCIATTKTTPSDITPEWFRETFWRQRQAITGSSTGRYITWFVQYDQQQWVLRHYWRGGLMEKFSKDAYLFTGSNRTRAVAELALLEKLYLQGLPVPRPVAANVERFGLWYRADILIERIAGAQDLVAILAQAPMLDSQWQQLGAQIAEFHRCGVYHADLNAKNILLSGNQFYLIDFDRGSEKIPSKNWQQANLDRLLRSFNKEQGKQPALAFNAQCWQWLMAGYNRVNPLA
ncbi:3-deoxy-D-manno-octulosonic acid kinase [Shewanella sp. A32]|uniref:3-deoxy-D-manno-octulosonic acid kinase n=1 Tax=Shewanella sp. A32 TaxID=3031327 RepID=UPI0023B9E9CE|nr:3-deoxy-D-manno-octulosonic acid kinase [Shewanella sp. A32]MDF0533496.1 3-deoxy-D-manno-octulosonic acid kinase [Shewanella sp. A32]